MILSGILAIILGLAQYWSEDFCLKCHTGFRRFISFAAGISISYVFLDLFPKFTEGAAEISELLFLSVLAGFVVFHLIEKYIYLYAPEDKLAGELAIEDSMVSFIYHFFIGILLVQLSGLGITEGLLFFIPIFFFTVISTLPVEASSRESVKIIVSSSTLVGVIFAHYLFNITQTMFFTLLGFIGGALLFTVIRHSMPFGREGKPFYFFIGVVLYSLLILMI